MNKRVTHFSFWFPAILFITHQLSQKVLGLHIPFIDFYLDAFCFGAIVPVLMLIERQWLFKQSRYSSVEFVSLLIFLILVSEVLLPFISTNFIADMYDALAILLGGVWFWILQPIK